jgi:hypothetical protein
MRALLILVLLFAGCASQSRTHAGLDRHGSPTVTQTGDAKEPGKASVETSTTVLTVPAGSQINFPPVVQGQAKGGACPSPLPVSVTLSQPSELRVETRREAVEGAKTPEPPPPPSPGDLARASGIRWFYFAGVVCGLAAIASIYFGYAWAAKSLVIAALAFPIVGNLVSSKWAVAVAGVFIFAAGAFYLAWKIIAARHALTEKTTT